MSSSTMDTVVRTILTPANLKKTKKVTPMSNKFSTSRMHSVWLFSKAEEHKKPLVWEIMVKHFQDLLRLLSQKVIVLWKTKKLRKLFHQSQLSALQFRTSSKDSLTWFSTMVTTTCLRCRTPLTIRSSISSWPCSRKCQKTAYFNKKTPSNRTWCTYSHKTLLEDSSTFLRESTIHWRREAWTALREIVSEATHFTTLFIKVASTCVRFWFKKESE